MLGRAWAAVKKWEWKAIVICFFTAIIFWFFQSLNAEHTTNIDFPIELEYDSQRVELIKVPPKVVKVNVTGYGWNLLGKKMGLRVKPIKISSESPLQATFLTSKTLLPFITHSVQDLKINHVLTDSIYFDLDTIVQKKIPVRVDVTQLNLPPGKQVSSPVLFTPDSVVVVAPSRFFLDSEYVEGIPINYHFPIKANATEFNALVNLKKLGKYVKMSEQNVLLQFELAKYKTEQVRLKIVFQNKPTNRYIRLNPEFAYLEYLLKEGEEAIAPSSISVIADFRQIDWQDSTIVPSIRVPEKYLFPTVVPPKFKVEFE